jgi:hypothetical protein
MILEGHLLTEIGVKGAPRASMSDESFVALVSRFESNKRRRKKKKTMTRRSLKGINVTPLCCKALRKGQRNEDLKGLWVRVYGLEFGVKGLGPVPKRPVHTMRPCQRHHFWFSQL